MRAPPTPWSTRKEATHAKRATPLISAALITFSFTMSVKMTLLIPRHRRMRLRASGGGVWLWAEREIARTGPRRPSGFGHPCFA